MEGTLAQARDPAIDAANQRGADLAIETERENAVRSDAKGIIDEAAVPVTVTR